VRAKALLRDGFACTVCKRRDLPLELHHIKYWVNGVNIVGKELEYMDYITILCEQHHKQIHKL
jgi:5-methylcytosine-specific restriction endonuclease McrA